MTRGTKRMVIGALLAFLLAPAIFGISMVLGIRSIADAFASGETLSSGATRELKGQEDVLLLVEDAAADAATGTAAPTTCTVTSPGGTQVPLTGRDVPAGGTGDQPYGAMFELTTREAGAYTFDCQGRAMRVIDGAAVNEMASGLAGPLLIGPVLSFLVGTLGLGLLIAGFVARRRSRVVQPAWAGTPPVPQAWSYGTGGYPAPGQGPAGPTTPGAPPAPTWQAPPPSGSTPAAHQPPPPAGGPASHQPPPPGTGSSRPPQS